MKTELFENINLTAESSAGILDEVEYTGVIRKDRNVAKFVQTVVRRAKNYRNRILSDIGGGQVILQLRNGEQRSNRFIGTKYDDVDARTLGEYMNTKKLMEFDVFFNVHEKDGRKFMSMRIYGIRVVV